jgi:hypothetical protein
MDLDRGSAKRRATRYQSSRTLLRVRCLRKFYRGRRCVRSLVHIAEGFIVVRYVLQVVWDNLIDRIDRYHLTVNLGRVGAKSTFSLLNNLNFVPCACPWHPFEEWISFQFFLRAFYDSRVVDDHSPYSEQTVALQGCSEWREWCVIFDSTHYSDQVLHWIYYYEQNTSMNHSCHLSTLQRFRSILRRRLPSMLSTFHSYWPRCLMRYSPIHSTNSQCTYISNYNIGTWHNLPHPCQRRFMTEILITPHADHRSALMTRTLYFFSTAMTHVRAPSLMGEAYPKLAYTDDHTWML